MNRTASNVKACGLRSLRCVALIVAAGCALVIAPVYAQNSNRATWVLYGAGSLTCGKWLLARESKNDMEVELIKQWVAGWIVSYNYYLTENTGKGRVSTPDFDTITAYVDKFCADKPLMPIALAPAQMVQELGGAVAFHNRRRTR
jgi:hypothetical protein